MGRHEVTSWFRKTLIPPIITLLSLTGSSAYSQSSTSRSASGSESTCNTSVATQAKPVECLVYRPLYYKSGKDVLMGACIYLGVDIPSFWSTVLDYNWVQVYTTNYDPGTLCAPDQPHSDPCTSDPSEDPNKSSLYRPGGDKDSHRDAFTGAGAHQWGMSHVFRDMPHRNLTDLKAQGFDKYYHWDASLNFVRVPRFSNEQSYIPIENISYGFTIKNSVLTLKPLVINGVQVAGQQTRSLQDAPDEIDGPGQPMNVCVPYDSYLKVLAKPPVGYTPPPFPKH